jgi:hypothetical protein
MGCARRSYQPRHAETSVLHKVIRDHLDDFLRAAAERADGAGLPEFIAREFREFLTCGVLAHGFARVRCERCALERLVPFSCKGRGFCPSCGGRRMTERAAHLVDEVLPPVPVRQWVLTLPYRLRYLLAWDHSLSRAVLAVHTRALLDFYRQQAQRQGIPAGRTGTVTAVQRFGGGLNLNVHFHTLAIDGVFVRSQAGRLTFHPACGPSDAEVAQVLGTIRRRVGRLLRRHGLEPGEDGGGPEDSLAEASPTLAGIVGASVQGRLALGARAGGPVRGSATGCAKCAARRVVRATRISTGSICTRTCGRAPTTGRGWSSCAATCSGHHWPKTASSVCPTGECGSSSSAPGVTGPRTCFSSQWSFSRSWQP